MAALLFVFIVDTIGGTNEPPSCIMYLPYLVSYDMIPDVRTYAARCIKVVQTQDLRGHRWEVNNFSNTVWEAAIWMHHFFQVKPSHWGLLERYQYSST